MEETMNNMLGRELVERLRSFKKFDSFFIEKILKSKVVGILEEIQGVVQNEELSDFEMVEEIVRIFEENEIDAGNRHDFG